jgi:CHASE2 domain-containing sensor protein
MKRLQILKESTLATCVAIVIAYCISFIPLSLEYFKALRQGFADFDLYDLNYSNQQKNNLVQDTSIVVIGIGNDRSEIADQLNLITAYSPKVIGIDASFEEPRDSLDDLKLSEALKGKPNIVLAYGFTPGNQLVPDFFYKESNNGETGYIDFSNRPKYSVIRSYVPFSDITGNKLESFTSCITHIDNPEKYEVLKRRHNNEELINYTGNLDNYLNCSWDEVKSLDPVQLRRLIQGKIVLLGFFIKDPPLVMDDLYYSPLNERVSGKSFPDMYGVIVHANILSMIMSGRYIKVASPFLSYLFAFLIALSLNYYFISRFHKHAHPGHGKFLLIQFLSILLILYFFLQLYSWFSFQVPLGPIMLAMVLTLETLGIYKNIALWLHKKNKYKTIFTHKHII